MYLYLFSLYFIHRAEKKERSRLKTVRVIKSQDRSVSRQENKLCVLKLISALSWDKMLITPLAKDIFSHPISLKLYIIKALFCTANQSSKLKNFMKAAAIWLLMCQLYFCWGAFTDEVSRWVCLHTLWSWWRLCWQASLTQAIDITVLSLFFTLWISKPAISKGDNWKMSPTQTRAMSPDWLLRGRQS